MRWFLADRPTNIGNNSIVRLCLLVASDNSEATFSYPTHLGAHLFTISAVEPFCCGWNDTKRGRSCLFTLHTRLLMTLHGTAEIKPAQLQCHRGCAAQLSTRTACVITGSTYPQGHLEGIIGGTEQWQRGEEEQRQDWRPGVGCQSGRCSTISGCNRWEEGGGVEIYISKLELREESRNKCEYILQSSF